MVGLKGLGWVVLLSLAFGASAVAWGCSCASAGPCIAHRLFGTDFVAEVLRIEVVGNEHRLPDGRTMRGGGHKVVTVRVVEDFSGRFRVGQAIDVRTGMGGGDCGFAFREGERYLIDAAEQNGVLGTGICSDTAAEGAAGVRLRDLRRGTGLATTDLSGAVVWYSSHSDESGPAPRPVADVPVTLTVLDGRELHAVTGADGVYEFPVVPMGVYAIGVQLPKNMAPQFDKVPDITIPFSRGDAGCEVEVPVSAAGRLEGVVVDEQGKGMRGSVDVYDQVPGGANHMLPARFGFTGEDGSFVLNHLESGTYWLSFVLTDSTPRRVWFYPGTRSTAEALSIGLDDGEVKTGLRLVVGR